MDNRDYPLSPTPDNSKYEGILAKGEKLISKEEFLRRQKEKLISEKPVSVTKDGDVTSYRYEKAKMAEPPVKAASERMITKEEFKGKQERGEVSKKPSFYGKSKSGSTMHYSSLMRGRTSKRK